ncbi:RHO protein GDP dissociation inhibitor [Paragonimus heterotremus]|uniref:RHO protein GDP dissociation inhibitor n=1 Tax=Paragonimus heterotremus TaxID=100268 RepID=A0A8J4TMZ7_9TREM|nr:RHO protein GDP dissociation inhibitor [Paragonimus heterotremus]
MADQGDTSDAEGDLGTYKAPTKKTLQEIQHLDEEDESLKRYKEALLGSVSTPSAILFPENPNCVVIDSFSICVEGQPERTISLRGDLEKISDNPISIPEGANYQIKVKYYVQRDIVTGLMYLQSVHRGPVRLDRSHVMLGSYAPQSEPRLWVSETFEAPRGMMHRGVYSIKSRFRDLDKNEFICWKWAISVTKSSSSPG